MSVSVTLPKTKYSFVCNICGENEKSIFADSLAEATGELETEGWVGHVNLSKNIHVCPSCYYIYKNVKSMLA